MPPTAVQLPFRRGAPERVGRRLYRKQILPLDGSITYEGDRLDFTRDYLSKLVESFDAGAYDSVGFQLASPDNQHNNDPLRLTGEILRLELDEEGDNPGLYGVVAASDRGAEVIDDNPYLGVSARIVPNLRQADGREFPLALQHVLATADPKVTGMAPWEPLNLSNPAESVVDLTSARFDDQGDDSMADLNPEVIEWLNGLTPEQRANLVPTEPTEPEPTGDADDLEFDETYRQMLAESGIDPDDEAAIAALLADEDSEPSTNGTEPEPALSAEQRAAIELANLRSEQTASDLSVVQAQLADAHWAEERKALIYQGIPPAAVELAEPFLRSSGVIELSAGNVESEHDRMVKLLGMLKGSVDLAGETQSAQPPTEDEERQRILDSWKRQYPMPGDRQIASAQGGNA